MPALRAACLELLSLVAGPLVLLVLLR